MLGIKKKIPPTLWLGTRNLETSEFCQRHLQVKLPIGKSTSKSRSKINRVPMQKRLQQFQCCQHQSSAKATFHGCQRHLPFEISFQYGQINRLLQVRNPTIICEKDCKGNFCQLTLYGVGIKKVAEVKSKSIRDCQKFRPRQFCHPLQFCHLSSQFLYPHRCQKKRRKDAYTSTD